VISSCHHGIIENQCGICFPSEEQKQIRLAYQEVLAAMREIIEAYEPSYSNDWQYQDGWSRDHRRDWQKDKAVRERLKRAFLWLEHHWRDT